LSGPIIIADNTSVIISGKNLYDFYLVSNIALPYMRKWFTTNKVAQNLDKTYTIQFITNNSPQYELNIVSNKKYKRVNMPAVPKVLGLCAQTSI
jgi:hypothetical protein